MTTSVPVYRDVLALLLAATEPECTGSAVLVLGEDPDPAHVAEVAHQLAHLFVDNIEEDSWPRMRESLRADLMALARHEPG